MVQVCLELKQISKAFNVPVLRDVNWCLYKGEIHGLIGENGAGKSTLMNILSGILQADGGTAMLDGSPFSPPHYQDAMTAGISLAAQELSLIETLSVAENILLRALPKKGLLIAQKSMTKKARQLMKLVGLHDITPHQLLGTLTLAQKQLVEIAKALSNDCKILILDEPTAALTDPQADHIHTVMRDVADQGTTIIYISHRLENVRSICDRISVLRDGEMIASKPSEAMPVENMIQLMSGDIHSKTSTERFPSEGDIRLSVDAVTTKDLPSPLSLNCMAGEIIGIAGLAGAGRTEFLEAIYGLTSLKSGMVHIHAGDVAIPITNAGEAVTAGMGFLSEDRKEQGVFADSSISFNLTIAGLDHISDKSFIDQAREKVAVEKIIEIFSVKCAGSNQKIRELSGGNQQKILLGRWLHNGAQVLLLDEPTRGIDVATKASIYEHLLQLRKNGASIIVVSSELQELTHLCDRIMVLSNRAFSGWFDRQNFDMPSILKSAFSNYQNNLRQPSA